MREIERKFLLTRIPNIPLGTPIPYERHFLVRTPDFEERVQRKGDTYEKERKTRTSALTRETTKEPLTKQQFEQAKKRAESSIQRESYAVLDDERITIKKYGGRYEGLIRAEIEFSSEAAAKKFMPFGWMGPEITDTQLGNDAQLSSLNRQQFKRALLTFVNK